MNIEELKAKLAAGEITQEEFDIAVAKLQENKKPDTEYEKLLEDEAFKQFLEKREQSVGDKIRTEYSQKLKDVQAQLEDLKTEKMTDEEKLSLKEQQLLDKEREFEKTKLEFDFVNHLSEIKLPAKLSQFVPGSNIEKKKENLEALMEVVNGFVEEKVQEKFGTQSHNFEHGKPKEYDWNKMTQAEKFDLAEKDFDLYMKIRQEN